LLIGGVADRPAHFYSGDGKPHKAWILKREKPFAGAGLAQAQQTQPKEQQSAIEVMNVTLEPKDAKVGDEVTVTAAIVNTRPQVVLVNVRLLAPAQVVPVVPDVEQVVFVEPKARRDVKWRTKVVGGGAWNIRVDKDVISEGRPNDDPRPDVAPQVRAALAKVWSGAWKSPDGFVYDAEMHVRLDSTGAADGRIDWTLKKIGENRPDYVGKAGQTGIEYVWGFYDPRSRMLHMQGYRRHDPKQILGLDTYRLTLSENYTEIKGATRERGAWRATFSLEPR
jgi:hypothetical protein